MSDFVFSRRAFLAGTALAACLPVFSGTAFALSAGAAKSLIDQATSEINAVINSGKSASAMYRDFERIFIRYADVPTIARSVLGPPARSASSAQIGAFQQAFTGYIARKYGKRFREFVGGRIRVMDARPIKSFHEVRAVVELRGQSPFAVSFMVSDRSGSNKFFDLLIEGISLLKAERTEIAALLDRNGGNIDRLTQALRGIG